MSFYDDQSIPITVNSSGKIRGSFKYRYTNRYVVINQGEFYIPLVFDYDERFVAGGDWRKDMYIRNTKTARPHYVRFSDVEKLEWEINWQHLIDNSH